MLEIQQIPEIQQIQQIQQIQDIPEINPLDLLFNSYRPYKKQELCHLLGVSLTTVCKWQSGDRNPPAPTRKLAYLILEILKLLSQKVG